MTHTGRGEALCRVSGEPLELVLDLGKQPLGNGFLDSATVHDEFFYDLQCGFAEKSSLFQLIYQPEAQAMFNETYAFYSSTSAGMRSHFEALAQDLLLDLDVEASNSFVVEIGCNDGILLRHFADRGMRHLGIEPSSNVAAMAEQSGLRVKEAFFSTDVAHDIISEQGQASLVLSANVICHIPDLLDLATGISALLREDGAFIFEEPYLGDVIQKNSYDQIYDEHVYLFSLLSVQKLFGLVGMEIFHVEHLHTHGGSMRYFVAHAGAKQVSPAVARVLLQETALGLNDPKTFHALAERVQYSADSLRDTLETYRDAGKRIGSYGATSKSTTVFNFSRITPDLVASIFDNTPSKINCLSPGVHIPIVPEENFLSDPPDLTFFGAWNHQQEIRNKTQEYEKKGGLWITHVPTPHVLT